MRSSLLAFHELTGCDSTSQFAGINKKLAWKVFKEQFKPFINLGINDIASEAVLSNVEQLVCINHLQKLNLFINSGVIWFVNASLMLTCYHQQETL